MSVRYSEGLLRSMSVGESSGICAIKYGCKLAHCDFVKLSYFKGSYPSPATKKHHIMSSAEFVRCMSMISSRTNFGIQTVRTKIRLLLEE